jgi:NTE family protein
MDIKEIKFIVANTAPFNKLGDPGIAEFVDISEIKEYKNREIIYKESDPPDYFYLILQGRVVALTRQADKESEIELLKRGTCFGIISLFNEELHSVTARSIETTLILRVHKEKFKDFLHKHPSVSFDFSRILSQRVRSRFHPKKIFQCKRIGIMGPAGSGKSTYMFNLGLKLKEETGKKVICVEFSSNDNFTLASRAASPKILDISKFNEGDALKYIISENIDCISVRIETGSNFSTLLNFLSENYHFILFEVSTHSLEAHLDDFASHADYIHVLVYPTRQDLARAGSLIKLLETKNPLSREKIRVISNEFGPTDNLSFDQKRELLAHCIYATVPSFRDQSYFKMLRRVSRDTGEIVLGLALGSGASFGFAHVGVLKVLENNNVAIDVIAGTSMGAVFAAMWALDFGIEKMERISLELGKKLNLFSPRGFSFPLRGFIQARRLEGIFRGIFADLTFYDIKRTLKIVSFDFLKREAYIINEGLIYKALAASCAIPGVFEPIKVKNSILLDGGILNPLPVKILIDAGAHKIIAVNISPGGEQVKKAYEKKSRPHIFDFIFGSVETMQKQFIDQAVKICDVVIEPDLSGLEWLEFDKAGDLIKRGETAAMDKLEQIKRLTQR